MDALFNLSIYLMQNGTGDWLNYGRTIFQSFGFEPIEIHGVSNFRSLAFSWLLAPLVKFSGNSILITSIHLSIVISYTIFYCFQKLRSFLGRGNIGLLILFGFPSFLLFTSGFFKESLSFALLLLLISQLPSIVNSTKSWIGYMGFSLLLLILYYIRPFQAFSFLIALSIGLLFVGIKLKRSALLVPASLVMVFMVLMAFNPVLNPASFWEYLVQAHKSMAASSDYQFPIYLEKNTGLFSNIPQILKAGFIGISGFWFIPIFSPAQLILILELLLTLILGYSFWRQGPISIKESNNRIILISTICYILILAIGITLATPNFGSLLRYRVAFYPLLLLTILAFGSDKTLGASGK